MLGRLVMMIMVTMILTIVGLELKDNVRKFKAREMWHMINSPLLALKMELKAWLAAHVASRSWGWSPTDSRQGAGDLSLRTKGNWIPLIAWMNLEAGYSPEPSERKVAQQKLWWEPCKTLNRESNHATPEKLRKLTKFTKQLLAKKFICFLSCSVCGNWLCSNRKWIQCFSIGGIIYYNKLNYESFLEKILFCEHLYSIQKFNVCSQFYFSCIYTCIWIHILK